MTNRIIKFRAWNGKEMIHGTDDQVSLVNALKLMEMPSELKWMQFTGLHDKNGKEIYEGDVVSYGTYKQVVKYEELEDGDGAKAIGFRFATPETRSCEVIGNIYENPELIS